MRKFFKYHPKLDGPITWYMQDGTKWYVLRGPSAKEIPDQTLMAAEGTLEEVTDLTKLPPSAKHFAQPSFYHDDGRGEW